MAYRKPRTPLHHNPYVERANKVAAMRNRHNYYRAMLKALFTGR